MLPSNSPGLRRNPRKRASEEFAPSEHVSTKSSPAKNVSVSQSLPETHYIKGLNNRQRVDYILKNLYEEHRWTIKDLFYYMVTEEPEEKWGARTMKRAKDISTAVFDQPEVLAALKHTGRQATQFQMSEVTDSIKKNFGISNKTLH
jgi:hypothetical protein